MSEDQPSSCQVSEDLKMFAGGAVLLVLFGILSYFIPDLRQAVTAQFGVLLGAAAMKMKTN
jgi:hypothetical protein